MCGVFRVSCSWSLFVVSLFVFVLFSSLCICVFVNGSSGASLENTVHVKNEDELNNAILNTPVGGSAVIILDNDITPIIYGPRISANKTITLTSNKISEYYTLFCPLSVESGGVLRLDGVIIKPTVQPVSVSGVWVSPGGQFFMYSGEISGHIYFDFYDPVPSRNPFFDSDGHYDSGQGGGVRNYGVFEMHGGKICGNTAGGGGGVYNSGIIKMFSGEISGNTAEYGGGVYNTFSASFEMFGGVISGNIATKDGGGVYNTYSSSVVLSGGEIFGNTASIGADVYPTGNGGVV
jgi:hypothetical protein